MSECKNWDFCGFSLLFIVKFKSDGFPYVIHVGDFILKKLV